jgi:hypothetical protein
MYKSIDAETQSRCKLAKNSGTSCGGGNGFGLIEASWFVESEEMTDIEGGIDSVTELTASHVLCMDRGGLPT